MNKKSGLAGFTLIELLVVVALIGLIATVVGVALNTARMKARDTRRVSDLRDMAKALELGYSYYNGYPVLTIPTQLGLPGTSVLCGKGQGIIHFVDKNTLANCDTDKVYMLTIPAYPEPAPDPSVRYMYKSNASGDYFCIQAYIEGAYPDSGLTAGRVMADPTGTKNGSCP